jgi:hypothetical protein
MAFQIPQRCLNQNKVEVLPGMPIGASTLIEAGKVYVFVGGYLVVPGSGNAATGKRPVVALDTVDNSSGSAGALSVDVAYDFGYDMANDGTHPVAATDVMTTQVYLSSPTTVSVNSADGPPLGGRPSVVGFNVGPTTARNVRVEIR